MVAVDNLLVLVVFMDLVLMMVVLQDLKELRDEFNDLI